MNPDRWTRVKEILSEALDRNGADRRSYLDRQCRDDHELRSEVESLLESYEDAGEFIDSQEPVGAAAAAAVSMTQQRDPRAGHRIGPYQVISELGRGGMGTVYKAVRADDAYRKQVAIKIVRHGMDHADILRRFRNERQILATLEHPNIAQLLDGGATSEGLPYFVMEYIDGRPIQRYCDDEKLTTRDRLDMMRHVCSAVQCAHDRKIVHRDIKPGNILINARGEPKLLDFGIAKILDPDLTTQTLDPTATVLRLMTPEYASPEQVRGEEITSASDVYSLGVLLYELLTGHRPYRLRTRSPHEIAQIICEEDPERPSTVVDRTELITRGSEGPLTLTPDVVSTARRTRPEELKKSLSGDLDNIVMMAMRKEPSRRYPNAGALGEDIRRYLEARPVAARGDTLMYRTTKLLSRHRKSVAVAATGVVVGTVLVLAWRDYVMPALRGPAPPAITIPLTSFPGDETQPVFAPDGSRIAFVWGGENNDNSDIYVKSVRGVGLERITTNAAEDVSPTWSPDGKQVAWLRVSETETAVYISRAEPNMVHGRITSLYPNRIEAVGRHLDWSPDGKYLAAADRKSPDEPFNIVLIEIATGHKIQLTNPPDGTVGDSNPAFSADGKRIAFIRAVSSGVDDIFIKRLDSDEPAKPLTTDKRYVISLGWSADSSYILFSSNRAGNHNLWKVPATGGTPQRLVSVAQNASDPVFSRDGRLLAYSQFYMDSNIWHIDVSSGLSRKLISSTQFDSSPSYSPDGSKIAFRSTRSGANEVWIANSDGTGAYQLTTFGNSLTGCPRWSPDGKRLAVDSRPDGPADIFVVNLEDRKVQRLTKAPLEDVVPSWSRDGQWVYFSSNRNASWQIWKANVTTGATVQVTKNGGFGAFESLDGRYIYYAKSRSMPGLWRMVVQGGAEEQVTDRLKAGMWGYWALSKRGVYFVDKEHRDANYSLYLLSPNGEVERIMMLDKPPIIGDSGLAASADGRSVLYAQVDQSGSDVLLMENPSSAQ